MSNLEMDSGCIKIENFLAQSPHACSTGDGAGVGDAWEPIQNSSEILPNTIKACFSAAYHADTPSASMRKLAPVAEEIVRRGFAQLVDPGFVDADKLRRLHDPLYVDAFLNGKGRLASAQGWSWTPEILDGVLAIQAGQLVGAQIALEEGIAANVALGFHHAGYKSGGAFGTFNGLALVAQEYPTKTICVLDCDEHGGNPCWKLTTSVVRGLMRSNSVMNAAETQGAAPVTLQRSLRH